MAFIMLRKFPSIPSFLSAFIKGVGLFFKCFFSYIDKYNHVFLSFILSMWCITLTDTSKNLIKEV